MEIVTKRQMNPSVSDVWNLLGERFADIGQWSNSVERSHLDGPLGHGAVRTCELKPTPGGPERIQERITLFDRDNRALNYLILSGLPGFMRRVENAWTVEAKAGQTLVTSTLSIALAWWMLPMAPMIRRQFSKTISGFMDGMKPTLCDSRARLSPDHGRLNSTGRRLGNRSCRTRRAKTKTVVGRPRRKPPTRRPAIG